MHLATRLRALATLSLALGSAWIASPAAPNARAQVIGLQPGISSIPDGAILNATPVVSADRRYVRIGLAPQFYGLRGVDSFSFPAGAVSGGGFGGGGFAGGGLGAGGGPGGGLFAVGARPPQDRPPAIVPRQVRQVVANQGGAGVVPGLAAVGSWGGFNPGFGLYPPAYGYGYGFPSNGFDSFGFGNYGPPMNNPWMYNPYNDPYVQPMLLPQGMLFIPRNPVVNDMGGVMRGIINAVGPR